MKTHHWLFQNLYRNDKDNGLLINVGFTMLAKVNSDLLRLPATALDVPQDIYDLSFSRP